MKPTLICSQVVQQSTSSVLYVISPLPVYKEQITGTMTCKERTVQGIAFYELYFGSYPLNLGCFCFKIGDESGRGCILTRDGQATLFQAKSLLTALVKRISNASITVKILELLHNYKDRFLQLLEAGSSAHDMEATRETERSLNERIREMQEFQELKTKVSYFIRMCEIISPGENKHTN